MRYSILFFMFLNMAIYAEIVDRVIISVNDGCITEYEFKKIYKKKILQIKDPQKARVAAIKDAIVNELLYQKAKEEYISVGEKAIDKEVKSYMKRHNLPNKKALEWYLRNKEGYANIQEFREDIKKRLMINMVSQLFSGVGSGIKANENDMRNFYYKKLYNKTFIAKFEGVLVRGLKLPQIVKKEVVTSSFWQVSRKYNLPYYGGVKKSIDEFSDKHRLIAGLVFNPKIPTGIVQNINLGARGTFVFKVYWRRPLSYEEVKPLLKKYFQNKSYGEKIQMWIKDLIREATIKFIDKNYRIDFQE